MPECFSDKNGCFRKNWMLIYTVASVFIGIGIGLINNYFWETTPLQRYYWGYPGEVVMMNMLKSIIIPLIVFSITTGVASMAESGGKLSLYAVAYYLTTTILAIINGIVFSLIIKPGRRVNPTDNKITVTRSITQRKGVADGLLDIVRNCFPPNIIEATIDQASTNRVFPDSCVEVNGTLYTDVSAATMCEATGIKVTFGGSQNTLGLIVFCMVFGYYLGKLARKGDTSAKQALDLFNGMNNAIMKMVDLVMMYHPIGLLFLISKKIMDMGDDMAETWGALGFFILTTIVCLTVHFFIVLPAVYFITTRKNPFVYMWGMMQPIVTAFANASSAATMPITMRTCEEKCGISTTITRFMLPLGATINMDGTALYEAIACIFIANLHYDEIGALSFGQILTIAVTATAASVGAAAVPSAGLITLLIVLSAVGLIQYAGDIALIYTVDWFLDRLRTSTNVWGDSIGCGIVQHYVGKDLHSTLE